MTTAIQKEMKHLAKEAQKASKVLAVTSTEVKNRLLRRMAEALKKNRRALLRANRKDLALASRKGSSKAFLDRLLLDEKGIQGMAESLLTIARLNDPVGEVIQMSRRPSGLMIGKIRVPLGVIAIIYESRPNVTSDSAGLCLKAGNAVILKGGSEASASNQAITHLLQQLLKKEGIPPAAISLVRHAGHDAVRALLREDQFISLVIPRGGESLIREVARLSKIPVIKHYKGICHVYVDSECDLNMAESIAMNAKVQRPATCNAMETLLVHEEVAPRFLPPLIHRLRDVGVEIRGCDRTRKLVKGLKRATEKDWRSEYLDLILSVRIVKDLSEAIAHITEYGSMHTDTIVTENHDHAMRFLREVDSACVFVNASTRMSDGGVFGMGAEIGISTEKLHARGPMGLTELTSYKFIGLGNGQIRT
ncbi:MAG: glutamate-5-semialdehyde dehydrogenase [Candidatus Omnitrophica bacterium]|nr:glutamate-5-semialdehyde dehydrogenase [Candidatus Omnitrophota bacterium]